MREQENESVRLVIYEYLNFSRLAPRFLNAFVSVADGLSGQWGYETDVGKSWE